MPSQVPPDIKHYRAAEAELAAEATGQLAVQLGVLDWSAAGTQSAVAAIYAALILGYRRASSTLGLQMYADLRDFAGVAGRWRAVAASDPDPGWFDAIVVNAFKVKAGPPSGSADGGIDLSTVTGRPLVGVRTSSGSSATSIQVPPDLLVRPPDHGDPVRPPRELRPAQRASQEALRPAGDQVYTPEVLRPPEAVHEPPSARPGPPRASAAPRPRPASTASESVRPPTALTHDRGPTRAPIPAVDPGDVSALDFTNVTSEPSAASELSAEELTRVTEVQQTVTDRLTASVQRVVASGGREAVTGTAAGDGAQVQRVPDKAPAPASAEAEVHYIRAPASAKPCAFCVMVAARSMSDYRPYKSVESMMTVVGRGRTPVHSAGPGKRAVGEAYHDNCKCIAVPIWPGFITPMSESRMEAFHDMYAKAYANADGYDTKSVLAAMRQLYGLR